MTKHFLMNYQNQKFIKGQIGELISNALSLNSDFLYYKQGGTILHYEENNSIFSLYNFRLSCLFYNQTGYAEQGSYHSSNSGSGRKRIY